MFKFAKKCRKGLSLVELMVVLIIVAIVTLGFGASASRQVKRTNRETVVNDMQILSSNLSDAYYDLGNPAFDPATTQGMTDFKAFLSTVSADYLNWSFDMASVTATTNGFRVEVADPVDVYEQRYKCWFVTKSGVQRYVMIVSGGDDGIINTANYSTQGYGDDIVLIVKPKVTE